MSAILDKLVSPELKKFLAPRERPSAASGAVRLHMGEAPTAPTLDGLNVASLNRVPEKTPAALATRMAEVYGVAPANLAVTADTADAVDVLIRIFTSADRSTPVILAGRGFAAAKRAATLQGAKVIDLAPQDRLELDISGLADAIETAGGKGLLFIASPTFESGQLLGPDVFGGLATLCPDVLFVIDESCIEFAGTGSLVLAAATTDNVVVLRSLSRAYGLSGAPCGALVAVEPVVKLVESTLAFRSLARPTAQIALAALAPLRTPVALARIADVVAERERLAQALALSPYVAKVHPSAANFLAIELKNAAVLARKLEQRGILVHWVEGATPGLRLTVGSPAENDLVIEAFDVQGPKRRTRVAETSRETKETRIAVRVDLDGAPKAKIKTGVGYFDHMLEQIAKHGGFDLTLMCEGDTEVDAHHTIEDCMLALGSALKSALGDKRGITRYGFALPMDEAEAEALIDLSGRPYAVFEGQFAAANLGDYPTEMTAHAFRSLAETMGAAIHVKVRGENDHHKTEACFKAFARALRQAIRVEGDDIPSTKGVL
jgi:histidinol-phosphate aminotransferase/imidazoleglycerol-phosphate dehydratase/histidinol-phosphatase